ncbi:unnamed protein product [Eruca vesicaria subsp. sativa]|uniref:Uncharacterized protein n=1 Tax=Eruca vesicaria subsp. sativa TaxID=29727 RepID=A0ABC8KLF8_ERUVS|nr:unnamed protein product [Eruca vesicaria subsp. sativa]
MAGNRDLKMKGPLMEEESQIAKDAYLRGKLDTMKRYRAMLIMCRDQTRAIEERHSVELNKVRLEVKLDFLHECESLFSMYHEKKKTEFELALAESKLEDVRVPPIDWFKLGEPMMYD